MELLQKLAEQLKDGEMGELLKPEPSVAPLPQVDTTGSALNWRSLTGSIVASSVQGENTEGMKI